MVEIMAEVTYSFAERYAMEFERLAGVRDHIHLLYPAYTKIAPWQLVDILKRITGQEVLERPDV